MAAAAPALALNWTKHHHFEKLIPSWEVAKPFQTPWSQPALQGKYGQGQGMGLGTQGEAAKGFLVKHNPSQLL